MYNSDRAITDLQSDLLGRASFSKHLGRAIYEYPGSDGLVIGQNVYCLRMRMISHWWLNLPHGIIQIEKI